MGLAKDLLQTHIASDTVLQLILDCSRIVDCSNSDSCEIPPRALERQSISLCNSLHI